MVPGFKANLMAHQSMSSNRIHPYSWLSLAFTVQYFATEHDLLFLAVQDSSIGDLVAQSVSESVSQVLISATSET